MTQDTFSCSLQCDIDPLKNHFTQGLPEKQCVSLLSPERGFILSGNHCAHTAAGEGSRAERTMGEPCLASLMQHSDSSSDSSTPIATLLPALEFSPPK